MPQPIINVEADERPIETVRLVGADYEVRKPKTHHMMFGDQAKDIEMINDALAKAQASDDKTALIELGNDRVQKTMELIWRLLRTYLVNAKDYASIRRRIAGPDLPEERAVAMDNLTIDETDIDNDDDLQLQNIVTLISGLNQHWAPPEPVKNPVRVDSPPPSAVKKASGAAKKATVRKRR